MRIAFLVYCAALFFGCGEVEDPDFFAEVPASVSGIEFSNDLTYTEAFNAYTYRNFYNGAGVALGDINNDGLVDIYFCGNQVENRLYLNKGNFRFEDITGKAGVACPNVWSTGASMADVNGDGLLDIFVCKSGPPFGGVRHNELFINQGDLTFVESAREWEIADDGLSIHAVFFDYDKDGDLDFYLLNNSNRSVGVFDLKKGQREVRDPFGGNKLYRNDGHTFSDVTKEANIYGSAIGFGLGVTVADVNLDGWMDIYVSNDFFERDYLYMNNGDGTFNESLEQMTNEISMGSMGADIADLNNDVFPEIYVTEMLPESLERVKTKSIFDDWNKYSESVENGYFHQFSRNVLQLNNGLVPGKRGEVYFSEVGRFSRVHATDWSWGALIFDYNNDGLKDIFVANGIAKDLTDQDYINFAANSELIFPNGKRDSTLLTRLMDKIPSTPLPNYLFENQANLHFENVALSRGLGRKTFSNGAAYGDLDNDGDLDLVVSNINSQALIYKNNASSITKNGFVQVVLRGLKQNTNGVGSKLWVFCGKDVFYQEQTPVKGYLSTVDHVLHMGIGQHKKIDSLVVQWPDGSVSVETPMANQRVIVEQSQAGQRTVPSTNSEMPLFQNHTAIANGNRGGHFVDFNRDKLLFEMISNEGQRFTPFDFDDDGTDEYFVGGGAGHPSRILQIKDDRSFVDVTGSGFEGDIRYEDTNAVALDANGDGLQDLYVCSGGNQFSYGAAELKDRLYINKGNGNFQKADRILRSGDKRDVTAFALATDFDSDGNTDLVVGSRVVPFNYGVPANLYLFRNDGKGLFEDVTMEFAPEFLKLGLLRDAVATDVDNDGDEDIVVVGEWMSVKVFINDGGEFKDSRVLDAFSGLWNCVAIADMNNDGRPDIIAGNNGLNSRYKASFEEPLKLLVNDFDRNGSIEQIVCYAQGDKAYPLVLLPDLIKQVPGLRKRIRNFDDYKDKSIDQIFDPNELQGGIVHNVSELRSMIFWNRGGLRFDAKPLPDQAQFSKIFAILPMDVNEDSRLDLIVGGNHRKIKPELGIQDANYGLVLAGVENELFEPLRASLSGIHVRGEVRDIISAGDRGDPLVLFLRNEDSIKVYARRR